MKKFFILIFLLSCWQFSSAQDFEKDLKAILANYSGTDSYKMQLDYKLYRNHSSGAPIEEKTATVIKDANNYFADMFEVITLVNDKYIVIVDKASQLVMIDKMSPDWLKKKEITIPDSLFENLQKLMSLSPEKWVKKTSFKQVSSSEGMYNIEFNYGDYLNQKLFFNLKDFTINKAIYYYEKEFDFEENVSSSKPRLEVVYKKFSKEFSVNKDTFSENKYLSVLKNGEVKLNEAFSGYDLVNHLLRPEDYQNFYNSQKQYSYE